GFVVDLDLDLLVRVLLLDGQRLGLDVNLGEDAEQLVGEDGPDDHRHRDETRDAREQQSAAVLHGCHPLPSESAPGGGREKPSQPRAAGSSAPEEWSGQPEPRLGSTHYEPATAPEVVATPCVYDS